MKYIVKNHFVRILLTRDGVVYMGESVFFFINTENILLLTQIRILSIFFLFPCQKCVPPPPPPLKKPHPIYTNLKNCLDHCQKKTEISQNTENFHPCTYTVTVYCRCSIHIWYQKSYIFVTDRI